MYLAAINDSCPSSEPPDCEKILSILRKLFKYLCLDTRKKYLARRNTVDNWTYKKPFCVVDFFLNHKNNNINNHCFSYELINAITELKYQIKHVITCITIKKSEIRLIISQLQRARLNNPNFFFDCCQYSFEGKGRNCIARCLATIVCMFLFVAVILDKFFKTKKHRLSKDDVSFAGSEKILAKSLSVFFKYWESPLFFSRRNLVFLESCKAILSKQLFNSVEQMPIQI